MTPYDFHMELARDAIENAATINRVKVGSDYPAWMRPTHLGATRKWLRCAKVNLALAAAALKQRPTLKPLRLRAKGGRA